MDSVRQEILDGLQPLFERAEREGLWFWGRYHDIWFSPDELRAKHKEGSFLWGAVNWELRDPMERIAQLESKKSGIDNEINRFKSKLY